MGPVKSPCDAPMNIPRRNQMQQWCEAERQIFEAIQAVERMDADVRLTDAVILLGKARDCVADFVDGRGGARESESHAPANAIEFFWRCWDYARGERPEPDGGDIQEWGVELGLLKAVPVSAPCGEGCVCADYGDFPMDCYRPTVARVSRAVPDQETKDES